jgi:hypothetical protein
MRTNGKRLLRAIAPAIVVAACLAAWAGSSQAQAGESRKKLNREIRIVEELFNDVLIDSPNWLVSAGGPAHAAYVDGIGLIVGFDASLVGRDMVTFGKHRGLLRFLGGTVIIRDHGDDEDEDEADDSADSEKFWTSRHEKRDERHYTRGKDELREAIFDCADAVTQLQDEDWIVVTVYLDDDDDYFDDKGISRYCLKIKARELRAAADANLTPEQMAARLTEIEY